MAGSTRNRDFAGGISLNNTDNDRSTYTWGNSIWNTKPVGSGFGSTPRDGSRTRDSNALPGAIADISEGKTGSSSLLPSYESDWKQSRQGNAWGNNAHIRNAGVSPARKRSVAQEQNTPQFSDNSSSLFSVSRNASVTHGQGTRALKPLLDPTSNNFTSRNVDSLSNGFSSFGLGQAELSPQRADTAFAWPDAAVHSPIDDRRSVTGSDHYGATSGAASRSGSLPPSRHGAEGSINPYADSFARFSQPGARQGQSLSYTARPFQERNGSFQSESLQLQEQEPRLGAHRSSFSINAFTPAFTPSGQALNDPRDYQDVQMPVQPEGQGFRSNGTYTPDSFTNGQVNDPNVQFRPITYDTRSAPNGNTAIKQSPFYSHAHTPPVHDYLNPTYRGEQGLNHPNNIALVQNKLAGYQIQQERRNVAPQYYQQYQHMLPMNQLRNPQAYQYAMPNGMPMTALPPHMTMVQMAPMMPVLEAPRGPRMQQTADNIGAMSLVLDSFKKESKQNKRWELTDIYENVVEFAGDQHGSRFIQQKLETANSEVKDRIFRELEKNALQLMQDVFGNYVIQKFFEHGDQVQKRVLAAKMKGHVFALSNQMYACRVVQKALEHVLVDQQADMVKELEKDVLKTVKDQNGNHVIQRVVERVPIEYIQPIVDSFRGQIDNLSTNSYGCRVIQRLVEKIPEPQRRFILIELHAAGPKLITDSYGNYVVQHVIEHGLPDDRAKMIALIRNQFLMFSKHKFASNVVERCLVCGSEAERGELVSTVIMKNERGENNLLSLLKDGYGNYVIQKMLETLTRPDYEIFVEALKPELEKAKKIISGKQIQSVERKMNRFDRADSPTETREDVPSTPGLSSSAESSQSSTMPSTSTSIIDGHVHSATFASKILPSVTDGVKTEASTS
ncbi:ARM repeat-containing protein [Didymella exigua CBS 183.55]|uniref:Pumilio homology domain family member 3 n=1 Tax=Didymella exigua CBS 183.55 TaxID=1150837 RepID=A0A6A5RLX1_9PLEO|nr:ARM repeat-containing protein [Didymella exigua CBS 183.55]KAF1926527.1 ARM repeat-containing protein [Didymella exigua CBS 183.55]